MSETRKTISFAVVAVVLVALAFLTAPRKITPNAFLDQGEPFFPDFADPNVARTLEVIDFDEETGSAVPFKVTFADGRWSIPSHYDYPADGKDRLAQTAAGVIGIKKDDFRSDNPSDHEACGVVDPLDETTVSLRGRGQRITIKGENDVVLADFIVGEEIEGRDKFRFVRVPGQKRVYAARMDIDISTRFKDWIESDLLMVKKDEVTQVALKDYTIDERTGQVQDRDVLVLDKKGEVWEANRMRKDQEVDTVKMNELLDTLEKLTIEGVRPKPAGLTASLTRSSDSLRITTADLLSLQDKGYFFSRDGRLLSNEGELQLDATNGVQYTLRFGEVVYGSGLAVTAGTRSADGEDASGENRYLFITTRFDAARFAEPPSPTDSGYLSKADSLWTDADRENKRLADMHQRWQERVDTGRARSQELNARFAKWYYVISDESYDALSKTRTDLVKKKDAS